MGARTSARHSFTLFHEATAFKGASEGGTSASERAGKTPSISSWLGSLRAPRGAVLDAREHDKKPIRDIATWLPVTLYILNDVLNGTFTLLPYVMAFNGWIGGLAIIWGIGCINYYVGNVLYRCSQIFPGAVSLGDLSYYLTRSTAVMVLTFLLSYLLMFTTNAQQFTMAANMLQVSKRACVRACVRGGASSPPLLAFRLLTRLANTPAHTHTPVHLFRPWMQGVPNGLARLPDAFYDTLDASKPSPSSNSLPPLSLSPTHTLVCIVLTRALSPAPHAAIRRVHQRRERDGDSWVLGDCDGRIAIR